MRRYLDLTWDIEFEDEQAVNLLNWNITIKNQLK